MLVKGINRTVIEITDTGSTMFEKVILFVTPQYGNIGTKRLKAEAERVIGQYMADSVIRPTVRAQHKKKRIISACIASAIIVAVAAATIIFIF